MKSANWIAAEIAAAEKEALLAPRRRVPMWVWPTLTTLIALFAWQPVWMGRFTLLVALIVGLFWIVEAAHDARRDLE